MGNFQNICPTLVSKLLELEGEKMVKDGVSCLGLKISKDKMSAHLTLAEKEFGYETTENEIRGLLESNNIIFGIDEKVLAFTVKAPIFDTEILIANGIQPENGKDGYVEYLFQHEKGGFPKVLEDGKVDFKNMNQIAEVSEGDVLCVLHPAEDGVEGTNVLGVKLPAKTGKSVVLPKGKNVQISTDGRELYATVNGQIKHRGPTIDVLEIFEVKKNVDNSTGNINFVGNVIVRGNVLAGFSIQSGGDVEVFGFVEKANIVAAGDIVLHGGMTGNGGGLLKAGGNIFAKYVENSVIKASGKITADCIMHSTVRAGTGIELLGRKGLLVGGDIKAREYIKAITIGSQFATLTEIEVGNDPGIMDRIKEIKNALTTKGAELIKIQQAMSMLAKMEANGVLSPEKAIIYERTKKSNDLYVEMLRNLKEEYDDLEKRLKEDSRVYIRAQKVIFVGVRITIGNVNLVINEDLSYCTLKSDGDSIQVTPY